jgi:hypothetical protein
MPVQNSSDRDASDSRPGLPPLAPDLAHALERLTALQEGYAGVSLVVAAGPDAIAPLTTILRHTETSGIFEIRSRAIAALFALGADDVLIDFIEDAHPVADPTARSGEEATLSIAARTLKASRSPRAFPALLRLAKRRPLPGVIEALASARRAEAIPGLIRGLDEDDCRAAAAAGLKALGRSSRSALIAVATADGESDSDLRRRRAAMSLLADIGVAAWQRAEIRLLIDHPDSELSFHACRALLRGGDAQAQAACRGRLADLVASLRAPLREVAMHLAAAPAVPDAPVSNIHPLGPSRPQRPILRLARPPRPAESAG